MLKKWVQTLEEVDEKFHVLYKGDDENGWALELDDQDFKTKLDEFRTNNRQLFNDKKQLEESLAAFKDIDPEKYKEATEALAVINQMEEGRLIKEGKLDEVLKRRTEAMQAEFERQLAAKDSAISEAQGIKEQYQTQLAQVKVQQAALESLGKIGHVRSTAQQDVLNRANFLWTVDDSGNLVARENGEAVFGKDGNALGMDEWAKDLLDGAPHLFEAAGGGGSDGNRNKDKSGNPKAVSKDDLKAFGAHLDDIASGKVNVE